MTCSCDTIIELQVLCKLHAKEVQRLGKLVGLLFTQTKLFGGKHAPCSKEQNLQNDVFFTMRSPILRWTRF